MESNVPVSDEVASRDLIRTLRLGVRDPVEGMLPESVAWHVFLELKRRGEPRAGSYFIGALKSLHQRRSLAGSDLPSDDNQPDEHRLIDDAYLGQLWRAYKKCIRNQRTGPASLLLRDIEELVSDS